jgi:hypothetical protein
VFIDETWIKTNMAPLRGWGQKGKRLRGLTFLGALRCDRLTAPCVFDGPINVMDNLGSHKAAAIRDMMAIKHWMRRPEAHHRGYLAPHRPSCLDDPTNRMQISQMQDTLPPL